jgi:hypothetical protein
MSLENGKALMKKYCPFLKDSDLDFADFKLTDFTGALTLASFMDAFLPLTENLGLKINDVGRGDGSPKFEHPLHLVYFSPRPTSTAYGLVFETQAAAPINMSLFNLIKNCPDFTEKTFYLILDQHGSKTAKALSYLNDYNFVLIQSQALGEDFFEFMGALHFKQKGYFVTRWHPFSGSDFFAYKIPEYQKALQERGYITKGAFFSELDMPHASRNKEDQPSQAEEYDVIAFEAEDGYGLALCSNTGVGQKMGFASPTCEVYGVGPITSPPPSRTDLPTRTPWSFGKRAGALVFTDKLEKFDLEPLESGFKDENEVIRRVKIAIKTILASRLPSIQKNLSIERLRDFPAKIAKIELVELLEILEKS